MRSFSQEQGLELRADGTGRGTVAAAIRAQVRPAEMGCDLVFGVNICFASAPLIVARLTTIPIILLINAMIDGGKLYTRYTFISLHIHNL